MSGWHNWSTPAHVDCTHSSRPADASTSLIIGGSPRTMLHPAAIVIEDPASLAVITSSWGNSAALIRLVYFSASAARIRSLFTGIYQRGSEVYETYVPARIICLSHRLRCLAGFPARQLFQLVRIKYGYFLPVYTDNTGALETCKNTRNGLGCKAQVTGNITT